jgi:hypothetical protein
MSLEWKNIIIGGAGVIALFKGMDYMTNKQGGSKSFKAEDWSGDVNDIPVAVDYFAAIQVLEQNGYVDSKKSIKKIQKQMMKKVFPFLIFERKQTKMLLDLIRQRLSHFEELYHAGGPTEVEIEMDTLKNRLKEVSSEELQDYFKQEAFDAKLRGLPRLPNTEQGVRLRFAPNPNGPLSMGHSFGIVVNDTYTRAYDGEYILRFDDTDPDQKRPIQSLYPQIIDEFEFLTDRGQDEYKLHIASENKQRYIDLARQLISEGKAYVSCIPHSVFAKKYQQYLSPAEVAKGKSPNQSKAGISSPDREKSVDVNLTQFDEMVENGYYTNEDGTPCVPTDAHIKGGAEHERRGTLVPTVWLKTPPTTSPSKFRDVKLMRATFKKHPNESGFVWPYLAFQGAVDDHDLRITHMIRGCDLWETEITYPLIWKALGWDTAELPTFMYWPRIFFKDFSIPYTDVETGESKELKAIGTSKMARLIATQPEFKGNWCHVNFPTVCSYMRKGYPAPYLRDFWLSDVWGETFPAFNSDPLKVQSDGGTIEMPPLSVQVGKETVRMVSGYSEARKLFASQPQVPYPLTKDGKLRNVPIVEMGEVLPVPVAA